MMGSCRKVMVWLLLAVGLVVGARAGQTATFHTRAVRPRTVAPLPLGFEANIGQVDSRVRYLARGPGYGLFFTADETVLTLSPRAGTQPDSPGFGRDVSPRRAPAASDCTAPAVLRLRLLGAAAAPRVGAAQPLPGRVNYLRGPASKWRTGLATYGKVRRYGVYPGIDQVFYGNQGRLEYDFVAAPGADVSRIRMAVRGASGARLDTLGDLVFQTSAGEVRQPRPRLYQETPRGRVRVEGRYLLHRSEAGWEVSFRVGEYNRSRTLVIDPILVYSTFVGGAAGDEARAVAVDTEGNAYLTGVTGSVNFPATPGSQSQSYSGPFSGVLGDAFVTKISADGTHIVYSTFLGGSQNDVGWAIATDDAGSAYVAGTTDSGDFPTRNPLQSFRGLDAFVLKLNPAGSALLFSSFLGGDLTDIAYGIAVDSNHDVYVAGQTSSGDFPTSDGAFQHERVGDYDAFVTKLHAALESPYGDTYSLAYSTLLAGIGQETAFGIAVDGDGNAYVAGQTNSPDFPVFPADRTFGATSAGGSDAFVTKLNADGSVPVFSLFLGGPQSDRAAAIALDSQRNMVVVGQTMSPKFPVTAGAFQRKQGGGGASDAFVASLKDDGTGLQYSTFLGGSADDSARAVVVDAAGRAFVAGVTESRNFPRAHAFQNGFGGIDDAFVTGFDSTGKALFSSYLGGKTFDVSAGIALGPAGDIYVAGFTYSAGFSVVSPLQPALSGAQDAFLVRLLATTSDSSRVQAAPKSITFPATPVAGSAAIRNLKITNSGSGLLTVVLSGLRAPFSLPEKGTVFTLSAHKSRAIAVQFQPTTTGAAKATLYVSSTDPRQPVLRIPVSGKGKAAAH